MSTTTTTTAKRRLHTEESDTHNEEEGQSGAKKHKMVVDATASAIVATNAMNGGGANGSPGSGDDSSPATESNYLSVAMAPLKAFFEKYDKDPVPREDMLPAKEGARLLDVLNEFEVWINSLLDEDLKNAFMHPLQRSRKMIHARMLSEDEGAP